MKMQCKDCEHRKWEDGDREFSPPGWGVYYCELTDITLGRELVSGGTHYDCPIPEQLELF